MGSVILKTGIIAAIGVGLTACAPGPDGYAGWSRYRQQQADEHAYAARRSADAAQWHAQAGDYRGAQQAQAAANAEAAEAQQEHNHAARDSWLSRIW